MWEITLPPPSGRNWPSTMRPYRTGSSDWAAPAPDSVLVIRSRPGPARQRRARSVAGVDARIAGTLGAAGGLSRRPPRSGGAPHQPPRRPGGTVPPQRHLAPSTARTGPRDGEAFHRQGSPQPSPWPGGCRRPAQPARHAPDPRMLPARRLEPRRDHAVRLYGDDQGSDVEDAQQVSFDFTDGVRRNCSARYACETMSVLRRVSTHLDRDWPPPSPRRRPVAWQADAADPPVNDRTRLRPAAALGSVRAFRSVTHACQPAQPAAP